MGTLPEPAPAPQAFPLFPWQTCGPGFADSGARLPRVEGRHGSPPHGVCLPVTARYTVAIRARSLIPNAFLLLLLTLFIWQPTGCHRA